MGYYYTITGNTEFNRPLTQDEINEFKKEYPYDNVELSSTHLSIDDETKDCDLHRTLSNLSFEFFEPRNIFFKGRLDYRGEEFDDVGYYDIDSKNDVFNRYVGEIHIEYKLSKY